MHLLVERGYKHAEFVKHPLQISVEGIVVLRDGILFISYRNDERKTAAPVASHRHLIEVERNSPNKGLAVDRGVHRLVIEVHTVATGTEALLADLGAVAENFALDSPVLFKIRNQLFTVNTVSVRIMTDDIDLAFSQFHALTSPYVLIIHEENG